MIVRIMGEGQFRVDEKQLQAMNDLDAAIEADLRDNDGAEFRSHLEGMLVIARQGTPLAIDEFEPSDVVLPPVDASIEELKEMMNQDGLVPG